MTTKRRHARAAGRAICSRSVLLRVTFDFRLSRVCCPFTHTCIDPCRLSRSLAPALCLSISLALLDSRPRNRCAHCTSAATRVPRKPNSVHSQDIAHLVSFSSRFALSCRARAAFSTLRDRRVCRALRGRLILITSKR
eukprot:IDg18245t1